jgi:hypothetical protein
MSVVGTSSHNKPTGLTQSGCDKIRPLWRNYVDKNTHTLYIHSCIEDEARIQDSILGLHLNIEQLIDVGARFLFVVFNKQDLLPLEDRSSVVFGLRQRFEKELHQYEGKITCVICDLPGFSAATGDQLYEALEIIRATINTDPEKRVRPNPQKNPARTTGHDGPSQANIIERISKDGLDELDADAYWSAFQSGDIPQWNHRSHLRAGYTLLLDTLREGKGIFETAETFLDHLRRLKEFKPDRFPNTEHRTMTIFWLCNLQVAILAFKQFNKTDTWPTRFDFQRVILHSPHLMNDSLWKYHYSKDLMFSLEAKEYWQLPDLAALPDFTQTLSSKPHHVRRLSQEEPYRVMRFAFVVVQRCISSDVRRGWLIKQALASLQSTTMRLRAKNPCVPPFSETQAYFWIQIIHAALASVYPAHTNTKNPLHVPVDKLSFSSFKALFDMEPTVWKTYYTTERWEGIEARMVFMNPNLKPLPNVLDLPLPGNIDKALNRQLDHAKIEMAAELPSLEDLSLRVTLVLEDAKSIAMPISSETKNHAHFLLYLYTNLVAQPDTNNLPSQASRATAVMMSLSGPRIPRFTENAFWTQQVLGASSRVSNQSDNSEVGISLPVPSFEDFIKANLHLVYEDLPLCYYSPELLDSLEAKQGFVQPDRRKMRGFLTLEGSTKDGEGDDWVVI